MVINMDVQLIANIYLLICGSLGLGYGLAQFFGKRKMPMYFHFVLLSMLSVNLSRLVYTLSYAFYDGVPDTFNVGIIGLAASFLFIFLANFGQMDLLISDQDETYPQYRIIALILPIIEFAISVWILLASEAVISARIMFVILSIDAGIAGYYNFKHFMMPDIEHGIIHSVRGFNLIAILIELLTLAEIGLGICGYKNMIIIAQAILGLMYALMIPVLTSEVKKWYK